jgi:hypothetical protein
VRGDDPPRRALSRELGARQGPAPFEEDPSDAPCGKLVQQVSQAASSGSGRQEQILQRTGALESKRVQARLDAQKKVLEELSARQARAVEAAGRLREDLGRAAPPPGYSAAVQNQLNTAIPKMEKVLKEFRGMNVLFSQKWLEEIVGEIEERDTGL